jgi:hypothetical protein
MPCDGLSVDEFLSWHNAMQRHGLQVCAPPSSRITAIRAREETETT